MKAERALGFCVMMDAGSVECLIITIYNYATAPKVEAAAAVAVAVAVADDMNICSLVGVTPESEFYLRSL